MLTSCRSKSSSSLDSVYAAACAKFDAGDLTAALAEADNGRMRSEGSEPIWNYKFRVLEADVLVWQHRSKKALSLLQPQPPASLKPGEIAIRRRVLQGRALYDTGNLEEAESRIADAQRIAETSGQELLGEVALARATLSFLRHQYSNAEQELEKAHELSQHYHDRLLEAKVLGTFGVLYTAEGLYDKAIDYSSKALALSQTINAHHIEAVVRLNMGWSYWELGDFPQAIPFLTESDRLATEAGMKKTQESSENNLGRIYLEQGDSHSADSYFHRALSLAQEAGDDSNTAIYLHNIAELQRRIGQFDEAEKYNQQALSLQQKNHYHAEELRSLVTAATIAIERKGFTKAKPLLNLVLTDKETPPSIRWEAEDVLANLYQKMGGNSQARIEFEKALALLDHDWDTIEEEENKLAFSTWAVDFYTDYISFLLGQGDKERALQIAESMRARTLEEGLGTRKTKQPLLQIPVVKRYLRGKNQAVLAYWLAPEKSYLWLVTPSTVEVFFLPGKQTIGQKVEEYQKTITGLGDPLLDSQTGQELYRILVEKAEKFIPPEMRVAIIPDGGLGKLNFETLIVPGATPHYWINDRELEDSSSISLLMQSRPDRQQDHRLLIIGDPIEVTSEYGRLRHAGDEINAAVRHFGPTAKQVVSGLGATPAAYPSNHPTEYDLVHFATHGFASDTKPLDSAIILSPNPDGNFKLYARDIIHEPVKAEVVTISACYGAGERTYSGQGLVGLAWAFLRAGAHRVIAGLWKVDDDSTPQLMDTFYADLQNHMNPAAALRDAKRKMLGSGGPFRRPYYWASLQLYAGS